MGWTGLQGWLWLLNQSIDQSIYQSMAACPNPCLTGSLACLPESAP